MSSASVPEATTRADAARRRPWRKTALFWLCALAAYWLTLFICTHLPSQDIASVAMDNDKLVHASAYAVLTSLLCISWRRMGGSSAILPRLGIAALVLCYGAIDEVSQPFFDRSCDLVDWYADAIGVACALAIDFWRHPS